MNLEERIDLMHKLGAYLLKEDNAELNAIKKKAFEKNKWFTEEFVGLALHNIASQYLDTKKIRDWVQYYHIDDNVIPKKVGIVMAGNIPLVGFHDFLSVFIAGHHAEMKLSEKDSVLMAHLADKLCQWNAAVNQIVTMGDMLKNQDAYLATGSNNSSRYFNYYFGKYPSIIRNNKTSVAILTGKETDTELGCLADDVHLYFGLGCRNVTKIFVPKGYDFLPLLNAFKKYQYFSDHTKYRNNYDYNLTLLIMNNKYYMTNESILLTEDEAVFSPVSLLHFSYYDVTNNSEGNPLSFDVGSLENIQCILGEHYLPFGSSQQPGLRDYADGIDTMQFLLSI